MAQLLMLTRSITTTFEILNHAPDLKCKISILAGLLECLNIDDTENIEKFRHIAEELAVTANSSELLDINIKLAKAFGKLEINELADLYFKQATELAFSNQFNRDTALDEIINSNFQIKDYSGARDTFFKFTPRIQIDRAGEFVKRYAITKDYTTIIKLLDKLPCKTIDQRPIAIMELLKSINNNFK